jgi:hypothetical protein
MKLILATSLALSSISYGAEPDPRLIGTWKTALIPIHQGIAKMRSQHEFKPDKSCSVQSELLVSSQLGNRGQSLSFTCTYETIDNKKLDITIQKFFLTLLTSADVESANQDNECGASDWTLGKPKDVTGLVCKSLQIDLKSGDTMKNLYEIDTEKNLLFLGIHLASDPTINESDGPLDEDGRPTVVNRRIASAGNGTTPPPMDIPNKPEDTLSGVYEYRSATFNQNSCDSEGPVEAIDKKFVYFFPAELVFPLPLPGWMSRDCETREECTTPDGLNFDSRWVVHEVTSDDSWSGFIRGVAGLSGRMCKFFHNEIEIVRSEDGQLKMTSKIRFTEYPLTGTAFCDLHNPNVEENLTKATCSQLRVVYARPVD